MLRCNWLRCCWLLSLVASLGAGDEPEFAPTEIQVPNGFVVEVAAAAPLVKHPMMAAFDDRGRLFIAESAGENLKRTDLEEQLPNFIRMIEDTDGDGQFDRSSIFADKMTFPQGALWHSGSLYVASSGGIWRLQDTDDDGVADVREQIVNEFGYTGNAADVHGCFLGPCGRIFWCEGRHGHEFRDDGGHILSQGKAARIFSCKADGSDVQVHCGGGMDNPVEIDFTEEGEMLGTVNILYRQRGDCLVHWVHGGVYPRHDQPQVVAEFKRTGDLLPPVVNLGHVAVSGTTRYRGTQFGPEFVDNFFITEFNTHKVVRAKLSRSGATFAAEVEEFLSCASGDFHPTDVLEDADGSLLVIDTGGWFRIGCPTSQIAKPNILGAIYRIRRREGSTVEDPRGYTIDWTASPSQIGSLLDDERFAVRDRAIRELASRGEPAIESLATLTKATSDRTRRNAVWALSRIDSPSSAVVLRERLADESPGVRQAATVSLGVRGDAIATAELVARLSDVAPGVQRDAATALGKLHAAKVIPAIFSALATDQLDRVREHALIYALIETNAPAETIAGLRSENGTIQRAALLALDQMDDGKLQRSQVTPLLSSADLALQRTAVDVIARHPEWSDEVIAAVRSILTAKKLDQEEATSARNLLLAFTANEQVQAFVGQLLGEKSISKAATLTLLEVVRDASLSTVPESWIVGVARLLDEQDPEIVDIAIAAADALKSTVADNALERIAHDEKRPVDIRVRAVAAKSLGAELKDSVLVLLVGQISRELPITRRLTAARAIGSAKLSVKQLQTLAGALADAGPLELTSLLAAYEGVEDAVVGELLLTSLAKSPGLTNLSPSALDRVVVALPDALSDKASELRSRLGASSEEQIARLAQLEAGMTGGDPLRGKAVFEGQRTSCVTCHTVQGRGGRIGPDLTTTGARRTTRDLLEAIVYPSSSLARGFETFGVLTTDGKVHTGLILSETIDSIRIRTTQQTELTVRRSDIEELQPSTVSVMPAGLDRTMSAEELRDLVAYLETLK
ncbi:MAG: HEAT repeat domain-containing protein [Planctomycetaceae bacterium]|nr:HEAT repeat domain-containing protein [Planctomycetales bacterium]MCB9938460.1 HEAT repeat domain-containing protein [Planctomycetaceae bacterium]